MADGPRADAREFALTDAPRGHLLANRGCWSADGRSLLFDWRADETRFDSPGIGRLCIDSGEIDTVYRSDPGLACGVPTCSPSDDRFVFIRQDALPTDDWPYCAWHRHGVIAHAGSDPRPRVLDARDLVPPYTPGALRGGTHLHTFHPHAAALVSTYEDHVLATSQDPAAQANRRGLAIHLLNRPVVVPPTHPRNQDGISHSVCVTRLTDLPAFGSDQIGVATGEAWVGGRLAVAFQGTVRDLAGEPRVELFLVTLPETWGEPGGASAAVDASPDGPLAGTPGTRPGVPAGVCQRRLTDTTDRAYPGIVGSRHWAVASPDGSRIGCYLRDDRGRVQFWTVGTDGSSPVQITHGDYEPTSSFTWHPDGVAVTYVADGSVWWVDIDTSKLSRLTPRAGDGAGPTHHACVFSPDGTSIAFLRPRRFGDGQPFNQIHLIKGWKA